MILVRTPQPYPTESLKGYVLRASEENGYESPWALFQLAGIPQGAMNSAGLPSAKIAPLLNLPADGLAHLGYFGDDGASQREYRLLGQGLGRGLSTDPLRLTKPAVCPQCVAETGFIDAFFDLRLAVACPHHGTMLVTTCPACSRPLTWYRQELLRCKCGASVADAHTPTASPGVISLMKVLWAKLHGTPYAASPDDGGLPIAHLQNLSLRALIAKLPTLASFTRPGCERDPTQVVEGIVDALGAWPTGFHALLDRIACSSKAKTAALRRRYQSFYERFFKHAAFAAEFMWMRDEFVRYGLEHADDAVVDPKLLRGDRQPRRYVSKSELARRLKVSPITLRRWAQSGQIGLKAVDDGRMTHYVADSQSNEFHLVDGAACPALSPREAAARLGLPVSVLTRLKTTEHFQPTHRLKQKGGFNPADVEALHRRLLELTPLIEPVALEGVDTIGLQSALGHFRFHSADQKADLLISYLDGRLKAVGRTGDTTDDIRIRRDDVKALVATSRAACAGNTLSQQEAARVIRCDPLAIPPLIDQGYLAKIDGREGVRVTDATVSDFTAKFVALSRLAHDHGTSSRKLMRICEKEGISLLAVPRSTGAGDIPFVTVERIDALVAHLPAR